MTSFIDVFERKEIKYRINATQRAQIEERLSRYMVADEYAYSHIVSLYFDTPERDLIARSIEKPVYKEKIRMRSYGDITPYGRVFVELKKKFKGVVYKRRVGLSYQAARAWLSGTPYQAACHAYPLEDEALQQECFTKTSLQIAKEIDAFWQIHPQLKPSMTISVDRFSLASIPREGESPVRITFDSQIRYLDHVNGPKHMKLPPLLIDPTDSIMEIKIQGAFPLWLTEILTEANALPSSFSKYGKAYLLSEEKTQQKFHLVTPPKSVNYSANHAVFGAFPFKPASHSRLARTRVGA